MITKYILEFDVDGREEAVDLTKTGAEELITEYAGKTVVFKGKDHKIQSGRFDPTRGIILTDVNGKTFVYAKLMDTIQEEGEEEPAKIKKHKRKMGRKKKYRHPTHIVCGEHRCNNCTKKVPEEGHTPNRCEKLGGPPVENPAVNPESTLKVIEKKKADGKQSRRERSREEQLAHNVRVMVGKEIVEEAASYFDPLLIRSLPKQSITDYLIALGIRELRRKHGRDPETGKKT